MNNTMTSLIRSAVAASVVLCSPGFAAYAAAAETVSFKMPARIAVTPMIQPMVQIPDLKTVVPGNLDAGTLQISNAGLEVQAVAPGAELTAPAAMADTIKVVSPAAETPVAPGTLGTLQQAMKPEAPSASAGLETSGSRWNGFFDRMLGRRGLSEPTLVAGASSSRSANLGKAGWTPAASKASIPAPARRNQRGFTRLGTLALIAGLTLALPAMAMAATAAPIAAPVVTGLSLVTAYHPLATAAASVLGAVYGIIAAHQKDGKAASNGEILTSVLKYGVLAGAGTFVLLDLAQGLFLGFAGIATRPLPFGLAAAAMGNSAFGAKFNDPNTTPGERIMGAFPAMATALGLTVGIAALAPLSVPLTIALGAMSITGVATAIYAAIYKPGVSAADGPKRMSRGFVLQSLMGALALSVASPYLALPLAALGVWGLWDVLATTGGEALTQFFAWLKNARAK
jgi:hypothetical protein